MLKEFLQAKPLFYNEIDYTRMPRVYAMIQSHLNIPKIIHIIGTNGKGTTGRFLASALVCLGWSVGHYTSPHILEFNERIWLNGANVSDVTLDETHQKLQKLLPSKESDALSYFEYTTLLAMMLYENCDFVVLEAGLGGEYDATAVFPNILTLVTPIDYDHEAFLGKDIKSIATTKLNAIQKSAILAKQKYNEVEDIAQEIAHSKALKVYKKDDFLTQEDIQNRVKISKNLALASYLSENLSLSIAALKFLELKYEVKDFDNAQLFGRLTKLRENVIIDVGHNPLAASAIVNSLAGKKYVLVYNSYKDKNYREILTILKPIIWHVEIIEVEESRIEERAILEQTMQELDIEYSSFKKIEEAKQYLVFGSFSVVEKFLKMEQHGKSFHNYN